GPGGEKNHGWFRIVSLDPPRALEFEAGCADDSGRPSDELPTTSIEVLIIAAAPDKTKMTITQRFASTADMEKLIGIGQDEGMTLAVGQIDAILATSTSPAADRDAS